jgi:GNAT superfamily N-acetyltransferase
MTHTHNNARDVAKTRPKHHSNGIRVVEDTNSALFEACMSLYQATFKNDVDLSIATIKKSVQEGKMFVLCLPDQDATPTGVAIMGDLSSAHERSVVILDYFFVNPAKRGKGTGSAFFAGVKQFLRDNTSFEYMILECVSRLVGFYERLGATLTNLKPSLCLVSNDDLAKKAQAENLLYLMIAPVNDGTDYDLPDLEPVLKHARSHIHSMTKHCEQELTPENRIIFTSWSRM